MPPGWIRDLYAYWQWLEQQVLESGGYLAGSGYIEPDAYYPTEDPDDEFELLDIRDHRLIFHSGHFLKVTLTTNSAIEEVFYEYPFAEIGGDRGTIWRSPRSRDRNWMFFQVAGMGLPVLLVVQIAGAIALVDGEAAFV